MSTYVNFVSSAEDNATGLREEKIFDDKFLNFDKREGPNKVRGGWKIFEKLTNGGARLFGT